jgi:TolB-like protein/class 3 adenylate cyclase
MASTRRLTAILAADVAGYSRLMGADEEGTLAAIMTLQRDLGYPKIAEHHGRVVKTTGDGWLVEFASVVDAVRCAVDVQRDMASRNAGVATDKRIDFRIGIHQGDIIVEADDIFGDGVNLAARLEGIAEPGGICVSRVVRDEVRDKLDVAFDDLGEQSLKNIARPMRVFCIRAAGQAAPPAAPPALALPDKPSLAVLPFQNMSGDPEQEYLVDGLVEDITTAIARLPWLFVIARNSSFAYKGKSPDLRQVGRELGVRYVLEGSVRKAGRRVRITGQLIDTTTGAHIWADRFDGALDDIFELQDQVASSVVGAIEPRLRQSEIERATRKPTESLDAYDLYLRALAQYHKYTEESMVETIALAKRALAIDPSYALAAALIGWVCIIRIAQGWGAVSDPEIADAVVLARQAIEAGRDDPDPLHMAGFTITILAGDHAAGLAAVDRALALNPNCALAWSTRGFVLAVRNQPVPAIEAVQHAIRLSPLDPLAQIFLTALAIAHNAAGRYEEAIEWADRALHAQPRFIVAMRVKLASLGHLGRAEEARDVLERLLALNPGLTIATWRATYASKAYAPELLALYTDGFRKAGLPEE